MTQKSKTQEINKKEDLSPEEYKQLIFRETRKCARNYRYCLNNYAKIAVPGKGEIPFDLRDYQEKTLEVFEKGEDVIILKSRQLGLSTLVAGYIACGMIFEENFSALVIATKGKVATNLVTKVKTILNSFPKWLMLEKITIDNRQSIKISNGGKCKAVTSSDNAGRSEDLSLCVIDEAAHIKNVKTIWTGASETLSETGGQAIILSTPWGVGSWYHKKWIGAEEGKNNFYPIKLPWYIHPERDEKWKEGRIKATSEKEFSQEHNCSFLTTGGTLINGKILKKLEEKTKEPEWKLKHDNLWIWKKPKEDKKYIVSADTADSGDGDYNAAHIIELEEVVQVAEYKAHSNPADFGNLLVDLAQEYNNGLLVIERNNLGPAVIQPALDRFYDNLFWSKRGSLNFVDPNLNNNSTDDDKTKVSVKPGFTTSRKTRPLVIQKIDDFIRDKVITINSQRLISELFVFINVNGKYQSMQGYHDDLVMACAIALFIRETAIKLMNLSNEIDNKRLDSFLNNSINNQKDKKKSKANLSGLVYSNREENDPYQLTYKEDNFDLRELI